MNLHNRQHASCHSRQSHQTAHVMSEDAQWHHYLAQKRRLLEADVDTKGRIKTQELYQFAASQVYGGCSRVMSVVIQHAVIAPTMFVVIRLHSMSPPCPTCLHPISTVQGQRLGCTGSGSIGCAE